MTSNLLTEQQIVELLAEAEETIGEIYLIFTREFTKEAEFWQKLANDELMHAQWVRMLLPRVLAGTITFKEDRFGTDAYAQFSEHLQRQLRQVRTEPVTEAAALSIALDIETTLVEKCFYDVFESSEPESTRILQMLSRSSDAHQRSVNQKWLFKHSKIM